MTSNHILHPKTETAMDSFVDDPVHALLITGSMGSGKGHLAYILAMRLFDDATMTREQYDNHPRIKILRPVEGRSIPIESIRALSSFLNLKLPGNQGNVSRIVVIEDAQYMTTEAQNALLKTLEEPPAHTVLLLTAPNLDSVLPTIRSRSRQLAVLPPSTETVTAYFQGHGHDPDAIVRALQLSSGLPGLTHLLLAEDQTHPLYTAVTHARGILQSKTYERLLLVDTLSKQKDVCMDIMYVIARMARTAMSRASDNRTQARWHGIMKAAYLAEQRLRSSVQAKLVLTDFMLTIG